MFSFPVDEKSFLEEVRNCSHIITVEENVLSGGLGSYVLEILSDNQIHIPVKRMGLNFGEGVPQIFMSRDGIREQYHLDRKSIVAAIDYILRRD